MKTDKFKLKKIPMVDDKMQLNIMILIFSLISFYTSYTGLLKLLGTSNSFLVNFFTAIFIGILQLTLVYSIKRLYFKELFTKKILKTISLILVYIITMSFSVIFSFSFWFGQLQAEDYSIKNTNEQLMSVMGSLSDTKESLLFINGALNRLSKYSIQVSTREENHGRTCDVSKGAGAGVYTWLRADDALLTRNSSNAVTNLRKSIDLDITRVNDYIKTFDPNGDIQEFSVNINSDIKRINSKFARSPLLRNVKKILEDRSGSNRERISVVDKRTGRMTHQSCPDTMFTRGATNIINEINNVKPIKELVIFDPNNNKNILTKIGTILVNLINPMSDDNITKEESSSLLFGFVVDFLILLLSIISKKKRRVVIPSSILQKFLGVKTHAEMLIKLEIYHTQMLTGHLIALPNNLNNIEILNIKRFIGYLQNRKWAKLQTVNVQGKDLDSYFNKELKEKYANDSLNIYKINEKIFIGDEEDEDV